MKKRLVLVVLTTAQAVATAQYAGKPNCEALPDPGSRLACMDKHADCSTPSWLSGADRAACLAEERAMQRGLEDHRKKVLEAVLTPGERAKLKTADAAYERFVKAQCELEAAPVQGGSMYASELNSCVYRLTQQRLTDYSRMHGSFSVVRNR